MAIAKKGYIQNTKKVRWGENGVLGKDLGSGVRLLPESILLFWLRVICLKQVL